MSLDTCPQFECSDLLSKKHKAPPPSSLAISEWVAVKELVLSYHHMDIGQIVWFWDYGNLNQVP